MNTAREHPRLLILEPYEPLSRILRECLADYGIPRENVVWADNIKLAWQLAHGRQDAHLIATHMLASHHHVYDRFGTTFAKHLEQRYNGSRPKIYGMKELSSCEQMWKDAPHDGLFDKSSLEDLERVVIAALAREFAGVRTPALR